MPRLRFQHSNTVLHSNLSGLWREAKKQNAILQYIKRQLPFPNEAISASYLKDDCLMLFCSTAGWATKLRARKTMILKQLQQDDQSKIPKSVTELVVKIKPLQ